MCTTISHQAAVSGCRKGPQGWFDLARVHVGYDHPFRVPLEHALTIDFVDQTAGTRLAVELDRESARAVAERILAALAQADAYEDAPSTAGPGASAGDGAYSGGGAVGRTRPDS